MNRSSDGSACADHCPFVNRRDERCSEHLRIDGLGHAYDFCFDQYAKCPVYFDQLMERRARRTQEQQSRVARTVNSTPAVVQVQINHQFLQRVAAAASGSTNGASANAR